MNLSSLIDFDIEPFDWLLVAGAVLAPMTSLRVWKVGPAEVLILLWCLKFVKRQVELNTVGKFFLVYLFAQLVGTLTCYYIAPSQVATALYASWFYLAFVATFIYQGLKSYELDYCKKLFSLIANLTVLWYLFLFLYAKNVGSRFMGATLWYGTQRFSGGATNPHQIAILMCGIATYFMRDALNNRRRILAAAEVAVCVYIVQQTKSSTGKLALFLGLGASVLLFVTKLVEGKRSRAQVFFFLISLVCFFCTVFNQQIYDYVYDWIASDRNGLGRLYLYQQAVESFFKSPIFGLGPGWHVFSPTGRPVEIHNTYLEILAGAGIVGMAAFISLTFKQVDRMIRSDVLYIPIIISIYAYGLAGFAMRKMVYWVLTDFVLAIVEKEAREAERTLQASRASIPMLADETAA